ncbi:hypothetical protein KFE25_003694 [Diacronema lutheri]|uniref:SnoaL-like domain-containing protein n=1 Tax=Diacronema lutheri TaxID=2081491 RepID=A0A8J5XLI7_DIALT|nr:hypothetical protein KFE25_003694 [Diacronema lutheri]
MACCTTVAAALPRFDAPSTEPALRVPLPAQLSAVPNSYQLVRLMEQWAERFGYYDGRIDLSADISAFSTPECALLPHAPLWGNKPGRETLIGAQAVRKRLKDLHSVFTIVRTDMHLTLRPDGRAFCLYYKRDANLCCATIDSAKNLFVGETEPDGHGGLKVSRVDEWAATDPSDGLAVLIKACGWPAATQPFAPYHGFGAV